VSETPPGSSLERVIVITGASSGIGAALAKAAASRGASLVLAARREDRLRELAAALGARALAVPADVTRRSDVGRIAAAGIERFGHIDVWVNNAGRGITRPVLELTDAEFDEMMLVNAKSALYAMQAILPHFQERGRGHVINVSSMLGRVPFASQRSAYSAAKHALNALTACVRIDLAAAHPAIHISTVSPPVVATEFGVNALGGGLDSRQFPNAQPVEEVAQVILDVIERPRADTYTRPGMREAVARYFAAEDMAAAEAELSAGFRRTPASPTPQR
jgi:short-subunit dehydrogenase